VDPAEALSRCAYLLERSGAPTFKAAAFRKASQRVQATPSDVLGTLAATGRLTDLPGLGATTAKVVVQALAGGTPEYLARLEAEAGPLNDAPMVDTRFPLPDLDADARALLEALRGDCHLHTDWSDGGDPLRTMAEHAAHLGHEYLAITDHSPRLRVAHGLSPERLQEQRRLIDEWNDAEGDDGLRLLAGVEVDILNDGGLDHEQETLRACDLVVASVHSRLGDEPDVMTERMVAAVRSPGVDILGHCTGRLIVGRGRPESRFDADEVFGAAAASGRAVEINCRPERLDPPRRLLRLAIDAGCLFSVDTDAHSTGQLGWQPFGAARAAEVGIPPERIVNTWPVEDLLAWSASHR
jgi:putative hydrolase